MNVNPDDFVFICQNSDKAPHNTALQHLYNLISTFCVLYVKIVTKHHTTPHRIAAFVPFD